MNSFSNKTIEALILAVEWIENAPFESDSWSAATKDITLQACKEALEQPTEYLYVYKGSEIWIKDALDIPSAGFLIGKIRLEK